MILFVHVAPEDTIRTIKLEGIRLPSDSVPKPGIAARPVLSEPTSVRFSHPEADCRMCGIYFEVPCDEQVLFGRRSERQHKMPAIEARRQFEALDDKSEYHVTFLRHIEPREIRQFRFLTRDMKTRKGSGKRRENNPRYATAS